MANQITTQGGLHNGGAVITASDGTKLALVYNDSVFRLELWSDIDGTPNQEDYDAVSTIFGGGGLGWCHAAIDSNNHVHMVAAGNTEQTRDVAYCIATYSAGSWTFGTWEEAADYTEQVPSGEGCSISMDGNNKPHVLYQDSVKQSGSTQDNTYYTEKTGASWATPTQIGARDTKTDWYTRPCLTLKASNHIEAIYNYSISPNFGLAYRTWNGSQWSTEATYSEGTSTTYQMGVTVESGGTVHRYHKHTAADWSMEEDNVDTGYNATNGLTLSGSYLDGSDVRYIIYIDGDNDIHLISNSGSGWTDEGDLQTGTYDHVIVGWSYNNLNNTTSIDYIFEVSGTIYWDEYSLAAGGPVNFSATGSIVTTTPNDASLAVVRRLSASALVATVTPTDVVLAIERSLSASALVQTSTPDDVTLDLAVFFTASALIQSTTPADVVLAVERSMTAAGLVTTTTPVDAILAIERALSATGSISSTTPVDAILAVERLFSAAASIASVTPDDVTLDLAVFFAASALVATTTPDTVSLAVERALTASASIATTTPDDVALAVERAMTAAALIQTVTPDDVVLSLAGIVEFVASALIQTTTPDDASLAVERALSASASIQSTTPDTVVLAVTRFLVAAGLIQTSTPDDVVLTVAQVVQFVASALIQTSTPDDAILAVERALSAQASIGTTTSTPALAVERALSAAGLIQSTTPDDIRLAVIRALFATAIIQSITPDDVDLSIEQAAGLLSILITSARPGAAATGSRPGGSFAGRRPNVDASGRG